MKPVSPAPVSALALALALALLATGASTLPAANPALAVPAGKNHAPRVGGGAPKPTVPCFLRTAASPTGLLFYWPGAPPGAIWFGPVPICAGDDPTGGFTPVINPPRPRPPATPPGTSPPPPPSIPQPPLSLGPSGNRACPNHQTQEENCSGSSGPAAPSSIREWAFLDIAPNQPGLGVGELLYYVDGPSDNFGSPDLLAFNSLVNMEAKRTAPSAGYSRFEIIQPDGSAISFLLQDIITASGQPHPYGLPESESAAVQAGLTWVDSNGAVTGRVLGAELRQYLPGYGVVHFPRDGGLATGLTTTTGRYYNLAGGPGSLGVEIIRKLPGGGFGVNGARLSGSLRQIKTPAGLLDIVPTVSGTFTGREFEIKQYSAVQVGPSKVSDLWPVTGSPVFTIKISAPPGTTGQATVVRTLGTERYTTAHTVVVSGGGNTQTWTQDHVNGPFQFRRKLVSTLTSGTNRTSTWTGTLLAAPGMSIPANPPASYTLVNNTKNFFPVYSKETFGSGVVIERSQSFDPPGADPEVLGRPVEISDVNNPGFKIYAEYNVTTRRMNHRRWAMTAPGGGGSTPTSRQESFDYTPLMAEEPARLFDFRPRKATRTYNNATATVGVEYFAYPVLAGEYTEIRERAVSPSAAFGASGALRTEVRYYGGPPGANQGRPRRARAEDGTVTLYSYTDLPGGELQAVVTQNLSSTGDPVSGHSTRTTFLLDVCGKPKEITNACYVSNPAPSTDPWLNYEKYTCTWDPAGNPLVTTRTDMVSSPNQVRVIEEREWDGVRLTRHTDDAGVVTVYEYHPETVIPSLSRRLEVPFGGSETPGQPEIVTTYTGEFTLDAQQLPLRRELVSTTAAGSLSLTEKVKRDETGRVVRVEDADGNVTSVTYSADRSTATVTYPGGGQAVSVFSPDGHLLRVTGSGVVPAFHHHAALPGGGGTLDTVYTGSDAGPRYVTTERDFAGRTAKVKRPALLFNPDGTYTVTVSETTYHYNTSGHLWKVARAGQPNVLYDYNGAGILYRTTVSANDVVDLISDTDSITEENSSAQMIGDSPWLVNTSEVYLPGASIAKKTVSTGRTMLAGFTGAQVSVSESLDTTGVNVYRVTETLNRATRTGQVTEIRPGASNNSYQIYYAGRLYGTHVSGSGGNILHGYDALGRPSSVKDPRHLNASTVTYATGKNRVWKVTDPAGAVTEYEYVPSGAGRGQIYKVTAPDATATTFTYDLLDRPTGNSGGGAYPAAYGYTAYGELHTMTTWRGTGYPSTGGDVTTWTREPATGLLLNKKDAASQETKYTYDTAGRPKTRLSPRGITATNTYYPETGRLQEIVYTPAGTANTPTSGFEYDRLGRMTKMTQGGHSWTYAYDPVKLALDTETVSYDTDNNGTGDFTRVIDRSTDSLLRPDGWTLKTALTGGATEYTYGITYDPAAGRVQTVSGGGDTFTYNYVPNAPHLISTVTGPGGLLATNSWEPSRDALDYKENRFGATVKSKYDYTVNGMGRRDDVTQTGEAFGAGTFIDWGYNSRGEVTMQNHTDPSRDFVYDFDNIGNRTRAAGGLTPPGTPNHFVNSLNQYTLIGGKYPAYDADGNLYTDGGGNEHNMPRTHTWDAENRLIQVTNTTVGTAWYRYDPLGRRHSKNTGGTTTWYIYDGWNLIGEYHSGDLKRTHLWGLDLSGTPQGAGGVGGLLCTAIGGSGVFTKYYPLCDGNGNVTQYLNGSGVMVARYEYSAYGYLLDSGGTSPGLFEFRFSTKKLDFETGLYYYGHRYYSPWMARWLSRDPIGEEGGLNLYRMIGNDAVNQIDYLGMIGSSFAPSLGYKPLPPMPGIINQTTLTGDWDFSTAILNRFPKLLSWANRKLRSVINKEICQSVKSDSCSARVPVNYVLSVYPTGDGKLSGMQNWADDNAFGDQTQGGVESMTTLGSFSVTASPVNFECNVTSIGGCRISRCKWKGEMKILDVVGFQPNEIWGAGKYMQWLFKSRKVRRATYPIEGEAVCSQCP